MSPDEDDVALPARLPIRVRPVAGETVESYIRRLAHANHLRPSLLQVYVRNPAVPTGAVRPQRLAAASGSTLAALTHTLVGLPKPRIDRTRRASQQPPGQAQAARKAQLFTAIRADAEQGMSVRQLAARHQTHRRMVRQALASPGQPPPRKRINRSAPVLDPIRDVIDTFRDQGLTIWDIWVRVVDEHNSDASYATVRDYIQGHAPRAVGEQRGHGGHDRAAGAVRRRSSVSNGPDLVVDGFQQSSDALFADRRPRIDKPLMERLADDGLH